MNDDSLPRASYVSCERSKRTKNEPHLISYDKIICPNVWRTGNDHEQGNFIANKN